MKRLIIGNWTTVGNEYRCFVIYHTERKDKVTKNIGQLGGNPYNTSLDKQNLIKQDPSTPTYQYPAMLNCQTCGFQHQSFVLTCRICGKCHNVHDRCNKKQCCFCLTEHHKTEICRSGESQRTSPPLRPQQPPPKPRPEKTAPPPPPVQPPKLWSSVCKPR